MQTLSNLPSCINNSNLNDCKHTNNLFFTFARNVFNSRSFKNEISHQYNCSDLASVSSCIITVNKAHQIELPCCRTIHIS